MYSHYGWTDELVLKQFYIECKTSCSMGNVNTVVQMNRLGVYVLYSGFVCPSDTKSQTTSSTAHEILAACVQRRSAESSAERDDLVAEFDEAPPSV